MLCVALGLVHEASAAKGVYIEDKEQRQGTESYMEVIKGQTLQQDESWFFVKSSVDVNGVVTIPNGVTLLIRPSDRATSDFCTFKVAKKLAGVFNVEQGGTLQILTRNGKYIVLDGGADFTVTLRSTNDVNYLQSTDALARGAGSHAMSGPAIHNKGTLEMDGVRICNFDNTATNNYCAVIQHSYATGAKASTKLTRCSIYNCRSLLGTAVLAGSGSAGSISITDSEIYQCIARNDKDSLACGIIRSWGKSTATLKMTNTKLHTCYAKTRGGGVYWLAERSSQTGCVIDGCEFYNNWCDVSGGGMAAAGTVTFANNVTKIHHNHAVKNGGGLYIYAYDGGSASGSTVANTVTLGKMLAVYKNTCDGNGGGFTCYCPSNCTLVKSKFNIIVDGARVYDNVAKGDGGGIWVSDDDDGKSCKLSVTFNSGEVSNNKAANGGGIFMKDATVSFTSGTFSANTAEAYGGGIRLEKGSVATFSGSAVFEENTASNGGGGAISDSSITINDGTFRNNVAHCGGGAYLQGDTKMTIKGGIFQGNKAVVDEPFRAETTAKDAAAAEGHGGGVYLASGSSATARTQLICPSASDRQVVAVIGNLADCGGDDIVCNGVYTKLELPTAKLTNADGYLYQWFEDYNVQDENYPNYMKIKNTPKIAPERYRTSHMYGTQVHESNEVCGTADHYLCLTLGYAVDVTPTALWITDHEDMGNGTVNLAFQPSFEYTVNLPDWVRFCRTNNLFMCATALTEAGIKSATPFHVDLRERDQGMADLATKGWVWVTVPDIWPTTEQPSDPTHRLWSVVIDDRSAGN